jgi:hypothetical protein
VTSRNDGAGSLVDKLKICSSQVTVAGILVDKLKICSSQVMMLED